MMKISPDVKVTNKVKKKGQNVTKTVQKRPGRMARPVRESCLISNYF